MKKIYLIILFVLMIHISSCISNVPSYEHEIGHYLELFDHFSNQVNFYYVGRYFNYFKYISNDEYKKLVKETLLKLENSNIDNDNDFFFFMNKFMANFNDGHSRFNCYWEKNKNLPIFVRWFGDELYVVDTHKDYSELKYKRIISIGGKDVSELRKEIDKFICSDNKYGKISPNSYLITNRGMLSYLNIIVDGQNEIKVNYERIEDRPEEIELSFDYKNTAYDFTVTDRITTIMNLGRNDITKIRDKSIHTEILPNDNIGYIQINNFFYRSEEEKQTNIKIFKKFFNQMKLNEIENIILDLRFNTGGYSKHIYDFLGFFDIENYKELLTYTRWVYRLREEAYPEKNEENSYLMIYEEGHKNLLYYRHTDTLFDGNLYVLTGSESFSLGSWLPAIVKDNNIGMVIGEPTANASVSHGTSKSLIEGDYYKEEGYELILPLSLTVRTLTLKLDQEELKNEPDAVYPHIPVKTTIDHLIKDVDPCWNYILEELVKDPTP